MFKFATVDFVCQQKARPGQFFLYS